MYLKCQVPRYVPKSAVSGKLEVVGCDLRGRVHWGRFCTVGPFSEFEEYLEHRKNGTQLQARL